MAAKQALQRGLDSVSDVPPYARSNIEVWLTEIELNAWHTPAVEGGPFNEEASRVFSDASSHSAAFVRILGSHRDNFTSPNCFSVEGLPNVVVA